MYRLKLNKTYTVKNSVNPYLTELLSDQWVSSQSRSSNSRAALQEGLCPGCMPEIDATSVITER